MCRLPAYGTLAMRYTVRNVYSPQRLSGGGVMGKDNQRTRLTKQLIRNALLSLLVEKEFRHVTVSDICERAEVNRSTFYRYYDNQFVLLETMENELIDVMDQHEMSEYLFNPTPENIERAIEICADSFRNMERQMRTWQVLTTRVSPNVVERFLPTRRAYISDVLGRHYDSSIIDYVETYVLGGSCAFITSWINKEHREPPEDAARLLITMSCGFIAGIRDKGNDG